MQDFKLKKIDNCLILGGGTIGQALAHEIAQTTGANDIFITKRDSKALKLPNNCELITHNPLDEESWEKLVAKLRTKIKTLDLVISTYGLLHNDHLEPEKKLSDIELQNLIEVFSVNAFTAPMSAKYLNPLLSRNDPSAFVFLSAKVGSIQDNNLGGWYAYRASKAALNMFMKNISIELKNKQLNTTVLAVHPGTTISPLSEPYIGGINHKIWSPEETAQHICEVVSTLDMSMSGTFKNWDGTSLPW
ncbi:MAG: SDR family NAD(P)-dependent oxidoreductase [Bacteriovoracaceae bacterium]|nr:SDR family NAD(P)-dependent oxidoreductase [Bacteriovoracaceae bacterium]